MGYYTSRELSIVNGDRSLIEEFREFSEGAKHAIQSNGDADDDCKWYSHENDLRAFSRLHPSALFELSGKGEESGDIWKEYYRDGKVQRCKAKITFDNFNHNKLT